MPERLDRARVVATAIELLDKVGLDGLTLRRLATELGVQAPALYWHFKNKDELLQEMAAAIARQAPAMPPASGQPWDEWLAQRARDMRQALNNHRDGAMLAASTHPAPDQFKDIEMQVRTLVAAGISAPDALRAFITLGNFVSGFTLEEQAGRASGEKAEPRDPAKSAALDGFPLTRAALLEVGDPRSDFAFEAALSFVIDGIRQRIQPAC